MLVNITCISSIGLKIHRQCDHFIIGYCLQIGSAELIKCGSAEQIWSSEAVTFALYYQMGTGIGFSAWSWFQSGKSSGEMCIKFAVRSSAVDTSNPGTRYLRLVSDLMTTCLVSHKKYQPGILISDYPPNALKIPITTGCMRQVVSL